MNDDSQRLLAQIINLFAERFGKKAILRGGMVLRIIGSPRYTNDLDYVFVPYTSKKEVVDEILTCLRSIPGSSVRHSVNSQCLRVLLTVENTTVQIEAKVAKDQKTDIASSKSLAGQFHLPPRIIHIVDHSVSLANKLAAWNERRLIRDIYDICFFLRMDVKPDLDILATRLAKPRYAKTIKKTDFFTGKSCDEFFSFLHARVNALTQRQIEDELSAFFLPGELPGLALEFKATFARWMIRG